MFWHFALACRVTLDDGALTAEREGVALTLSWPVPFSARLVHGSESPPLGWISEHFDTKLPSHTLVVSGATSGKWRGITTMQITP
jgi:hypothetical protein